MIAMLSVFIFSFCLLSIKPFLEKRKFISPRCFHPVMLINLNLPAESVRTLTPLLVMITLSNGTLLASVTIPFRYITLSHEHKAIPVNAQNIIFRITLICTYSFIETSAKPTTLSFGGAEGGSLCSHSLPLGGLGWVFGRVRVGPSSRPSLYLPNQTSGFSFVVSLRNWN